MTEDVVATVETFEYKMAIVSCAGKDLITGGGNASCISIWKGIDGSASCSSVGKGPGTDVVFGSPFAAMNGSPTSPLMYASAVKLPSILACPHARHALYVFARGDWRA